MTSFDSALSHSLPAQLLADAQAEADRFSGKLPAAPWAPGGDAAEPSPLWQRVAWAVVPACALAVAAIVMVKLGWASDDAPLRPAGAGSTATVADSYTATVGTGDPEEDIIDDAPPAPAPESPQPRANLTPASPHAPLDISRRGNEWRIDASGASRLLVAQRLAEATGSRLLGNVALLSNTRPLDLNWKGRQAALAWQAVLGSELSFATQCNSRRCLVWILEAGEATAAVPALPMRPVIAMQGDSVPAAATAVASSAEVAAVAALPGDSADPRIAAHHD